MKPCLLLSLVARAALVLCVIASTACVSNHVLPPIADIDAPGLAAELGARPGEADALIDVAYLPLVHLDLKTFSRNAAGEPLPEGHEYLSLRSWLPLFAVVDGEVAHFDADDAEFERSEFLAVLWGLWSQSRTTVQTSHGERIERDGRLLWLFDWDDSIEYARP